MFGPVNFVLRWLFTLFVVFGTYNPSGTSFWHWSTSGRASWTLVAVVGIALVGAYWFVLRATWRSIKLVGLTIAIVFMFLFNVMLVDLGVVEAGNWAIQLMILFSLATILSVGVSFSAIRARLSGQIDSDDVGR